MASAAASARCRLSIVARPLRRVEMAGRRARDAASLARIADRSANRPPRSDLVSRRRSSGLGIRISQAKSSSDQNRFDGALLVRDSPSPLDGPRRLLLFLRKSIRTLGFGATLSRLG